MFNTIEEGLAAFKSGNPILLIDDESRENEGDIIFSAAQSTPAKINFCATHARGLVCVAISKNIAQKLDLHPVVHNPDIQRFQDLRVIFLFDPPYLISSTISTLGLIFSFSY